MTNLTAFLLVLACQTEPAPAAGLEAKVLAYTRRLGDESARDRARDRLVHLGRAALPWIEKAELDPALLASIKEEIAFNDSISGSYAAPHLFSFDGKEESLGALLNRLETESGMSFQKNSLDLSQRLGFKLDEASFWESLDEICKRASIWYYPATDPLYLNGGIPSSKPRTYHGPLMIVLDRLIQQRRVGFDRTETDLTLHLMCVWERQVTALGLTSKFQLRKIVDDRGVSLLADAAPRPSAQRALQLVRPQGQMVVVPGLKPPSEGAKGLSLIEGTLELEFPARLDEVRFERPSETAPATREIEGGGVELRSCTPQASWGATFEFALTFRDEKEAAEFRIGSNDLDFLSSGGSPRSGWVGSARLEKGVYLFTAHWRNNGRSEMPSEIRLRIPRGSLVKNVPFRFRNVELK